MASLKDMRNRISSVKATQKITKAMQMVAAAKLRRAQDAAENARPYAGRMAAVIANLASGVSGADAPALLAGTGFQHQHLIVVATADRGLCGGFNTQIVRSAREKIEALLAEGKDVSILCIGKKSRDQLRRQYGDRIVGFFDLSGSKTLGIAQAQPIADAILDLYTQGKADVVTLVYSRFRSVISQVPAHKQLIPAQFDADQSEVTSVYQYEPSETDILETLLPRNLTVQILSSLLENAAGEQGARMQAMDNATRNAGEMINKLTLQYNRSRQAMITKELIEIISGADAI